MSSVCNLPVQQYRIHWTFQSLNASCNWKLLLAPLLSYTISSTLTFIMHLRDPHWPVPLCRDRLLSQWLPLLADFPLTARTYEEGALLRDRAAVHSLSRILHTLNEFTITLETALVKGVDLWPQQRSTELGTGSAIYCRNADRLKYSIFPSAGEGSTFRHLSNVTLS